MPRDIRCGLSEEKEQAGNHHALLEDPEAETRGETMSQDNPTHSEVGEENVRQFLRRRAERYAERGIMEMPEKFRKKAGAP